MPATAGIVARNVTEFEATGAPVINPTGSAGSSSRSPVSYGNDRGSSL
jgi:hypothetical protein